MTQAYNMPQFMPPPVRRPVWPTVIGILSICFGGLGLLCGSIGMIANLVGPFKDMTKMASPSGLDFTPPSGLHAATVATSLLGLTIAILLLIGGILVLRRRRAGVALHVAYIVLQFLNVVASMAVQYMMVSWMQSKFGELAQAPHMPMEAFKVQMVVAMATTALFGLPYPIFLAVWFLRPVIRQQVASWGAPPQAPDLPGAMVK